MFSLHILDILSVYFGIDYMYHLCSQILDVLDTLYIHSSYIIFITCSILYGDVFKKDTLQCNELRLFGCHLAASPA